MRFVANAKINLGLDVLGKRPDGYHDVRMVMQKVALHDELFIERTVEPGVVINTDKEFIPTGKDNLITKAAELMIRHYGLSGGIKINLIKNIPAAAGLAGGSADAAATLRAVNVLFDLGLSDDTLREFGVKIGADIPYCVSGGTVLAEGIGEILTPLKSCPECEVLLVKPMIDISTPYVYSQLSLDGIEHPDIDAITDGIENGDIRKIAANLGNVLESVTETQNPIITHIKDVMKSGGAIPGGVLMSGSGPTVFGLFEKEDDVKRVQDLLGKEEGLVIIQTKIAGPSGELKRL